MKLKQSLNSAAQRSPIQPVVSRSQRQLFPHREFQIRCVVRREAVFQCQIGYVNPGLPGTLFVNRHGEFVQKQTRRGIVDLLNPPSAQQEQQRVRHFIRPQWRNGYDAACRDVVQQPVRQRRGLRSNRSRHGSRSIGHESRVHGRRWSTAALSSASVGALYPLRFAILARNSRSPATAFRTVTSDSRPSAIICATGLS
jgi:hypothetical protein